MHACSALPSALVGAAGGAVSNGKPVRVVASPCSCVCRPSWVHFASSCTTPFRKASSCCPRSRRPGSSRWLTTRSRAGGRRRWSSAWPTWRCGWPTPRASGRRCSPTWALRARARSSWRATWRPPPRAAPSWRRRWRRRRRRRRRAPGGSGRGRVAGSCASPPARRGARSWSGARPTRPNAWRRRLRPSRCDARSLALAADPFRTSP